MVAKKSKRSAKASKASTTSRTRRASIPDSLKRQVLTEAGYRCGVPTCRNILAIDLHHIDEVSEGGGNNLGNLIALCPTCHGLYHRGTYSRESIYAWKQVLVSLSFAFDLPTIDLMLFLHKTESDRGFVVKHDGLLHFARLIGNGLATYQWIVAGIDSFQIPGYKVTLSTKGKHLIEAWLSGNRAAVQKVFEGGEP